MFRILDALQVNQQMNVFFSTCKKLFFFLILGLVPAGPLLSGMSALVRLDSSDASFVDVIHTNGLGKAILIIRSLKFS